MTFASVPFSISATYAPVIAPSFDADAVTVRPSFAVAVFTTAETVGFSL